MALRGALSLRGQCKGRRVGVAAAAFDEERKASRDFELRAQARVRSQSGRRSPVSPRQNCAALASRRSRGFPLLGRSASAGLAEAGAVLAAPRGDGI
jgi:hypothetical protein